MKNAIWYLLWVFVLLGDITIICVASYIVYVNGFDIITILLVAGAFYAWHMTGGFSAWNPTKVKTYFENAKKIP